MDFQLANRLDEIEPFHVMEVLKRAAELAQAGRSIIPMCIGEPDFPPPQPVLDAARAALDSGAAMRYTAALGLPELREAISGYYRQTFGVEVPAARIIVTAGASAALLLACAALVERDAEVLLPDPSYPCNRHFVAAFNGKPVLVTSGPEQRFQLSAAMVEAHWSERTRGVLLASPSNPTGTSILPDELQRTLDVVRRHRGFALVDEIYQGLSYDAAPHTALSHGDDLIVINSFSKTFNMTGWRLCWLVVPPAMLPAIEKLAQNFFICPSSIAQYAALACFKPETLAVVEARRLEFRRRRDYLVPELLKLGLEIPVLPDGAFYVYADCSRLAADSDQLARDVLDKTGVVLTPGLDFGSAAAHRFLRISYATSMENLQEAVARLRGYVGLA